LEEVRNTKLEVGKKKIETRHRKIEFRIKIRDGSNTSSWIPNIVALGAEKIIEWL
jgi:hypothetical protein